MKSCWAMWFTRFRQDERGATDVEDAVVLALTLAVGLGVLLLLASRYGGLLGVLGSALVNSGTR